MDRLMRHRTIPVSTAAITGQRAAFNSIYRLNVLSHQCSDTARFMSSTTNDPKPTIIAQRLPQDTIPASIRVTHPKSVFREQMRVLRRSYKEEHLQKVHEAAQVAVQTKALTEETEHLKQEDIKQFKKKRDAYMQGIDAFISPIPSLPSPVDAVLARNNKQFRSDTTDATDETFESRKRLWNQFIVDRRTRRYKNLVTFKQEESKVRRDALTYLYHSAADFVSYRNMDAKIDEVLKMNMLLYRTLPELAMAADQEETGNPTSKSTKRREDTLKGELLGTFANGRMTSDTILSKQDATLGLDSIIPDSEQFGK
ncbi:hypothetical protein BATDEDRAFT_91350 [Batrachochytrium dendrobatidis JAM81]|uniref:Uncharacterized protein n=1 Tax=Batrachochytrium dendrobatidis (strain JAM81 / FGSC 10211) TaxID=684364 RepID=F4PAI7_BATDJ|nr:uncharacterized protein BATDEDRAFT_91350 [Batrachochytrium dendrobatidis JAM81]EGF77546.1 hypothetical protein BATDEDRAFT_91350 [Batrachochytrium dendrobatidis JAM81]|eukprot:XP_006681754.1 hypothetical protein BATDEDRAFT_91350 [Batrachochytrium dendrobatidis JAM81]